MHGDRLKNFRSILKRRKNYLCHILEGHPVNGVRQTETHASELLGSEIIYFEYETSE